MQLSTLFKTGFAALALTGLTASASFANFGLQADSFDDDRDRRIAERSEQDLDLFLKANDLPPVGVYCIGTSNCEAIMVYCEDHHGAGQFECHLPGFDGCVVGECPD